MRTAAPDQPARKRPKDRKAQLATAAAELFCERGYHGVGLGDIATAVGISGPAIYRHFDSKYAMLVHATRQLMDAVLSATDLPGAHLDELFGVLARLAVEHRRVGGLYQWEWRYLDHRDRAGFRRDLGTLFERLSSRIAAKRRDLTGADVDALVRAVLSVFGSLSTHRAPIAKGRAEQMLPRMAWAVVSAQPPTPSYVQDSPFDEVRVGTRREIILAESVRLFREHGYHGVSLDQIGLASGINASSVYRYFPGKADILAAAFYRASARVADATLTALNGAAGDEDALRRLAESYVNLTFERADLVSVYLSEFNNLPAADRHELRKAQRLHVEEWVQLLLLLRPGLQPPEARVLVHAALNVVTDLSRWVRFDRRSRMDEHLTGLMLTILAS
ncbi:TetR family transcriptional regulator [Paractinoplanes deccanensis]|uniref:TetR family transcriptional regulator n=1 Tax=Paractinoplanes deccanensis TaxID=113561 RepID=A0ABQ3YBT8_9ACTN|nr:TetR/AcrR family transcriptional regulator [Actinoplanes deccanensis]GID77481.1 TetR family transcriptional regulator [Actinoplanes deccanensis]